MKKLLFIISSIIAFTLSVSVFAANGDVVGHIFSTDIRAFINNVEVKSYNIGGKTAVVIEDIGKADKQTYRYNDDTRTLEILTLNPLYLTEEGTNNNSAPGRVIGNIYKTDITTSVYCVSVPAYNIGGKTAVALEDLGYDRAFSPIGGKYIWDETKRTISLEFLYDNISGVSKNINTDILINDDLTEAEATFYEAFHCDGRQLNFKYPDSYTAAADATLILPIKANGEALGYYFKKPLPDDSFISFICWNQEKVKEAEKDYTHLPPKTREEIIAHFIGAHSLGEATERFDTEEYSFIYISVAGTSWTAYELIQVYDNGTYIDYREKIDMRNRSPRGLVIDKESEKVTFKHEDRYTKEWFTNYEIDLKTGEIKAI